MMVEVKICGLTDRAMVDAAVGAGADYVGFVFFPPSPRAIAGDAARPLAEIAKGRSKSVGLFVDPDDALLSSVLSQVPLDMIQLHGNEPPQRAAEIGARWHCPVIKALKISDAADLDDAARYSDAVDSLMFDAKPPKGATRPGGNANAFDWSLLQGRSWTKPWFLAGGLTPDNVGTAVRLTSARRVDTSSGVEDGPGQKNPHKIKQFISAARAG